MNKENIFAGINGGVNFQFDIWSVQHSLSAKQNEDVRLYNSLLHAFGSQVPLLHVVPNLGRAHVSACGQ